VLNKWVVIFYVADCCSPWYLLWSLSCACRRVTYLYFQKYTQHRIIVTELFISLCFFTPH